MESGEVCVEDRTQGRSGGREKQHARRQGRTFVNFGTLWTDFRYPGEVGLNVVYLSLGDISASVGRRSARSYDDGEEV